MRWEGKRHGESELRIPIPDYGSLGAIYASMSWRLTEPLRKVKAVARSLERGLRVRRKRLFSNLRSLLRGEAMRAPADASQTRLPNSVLHDRDGEIRHNRNGENLSDLSPRAREIYFQLKAAIAKKAERK